MKRLCIIFMVGLLGFGLIVASPSVGLQLPTGSFEISPSTYKKTGTVHCGYLSGKWQVGVKVTSTAFLGYNQQATNFLVSARKSRGAAKAKFEGQARVAALNALKYQSKCDKLPPPKLPTGSFEISSSTYKKSGTVHCGFFSGKWQVGTPVNSTVFLSYKQQATNFLASARKSRGAAKAEFEEQGGIAAINALKHQSKCDKLPTPKLSEQTTPTTSARITPIAFVSTQPATTAPQTSPVTSTATTAPQTSPVTSTATTAPPTSPVTSPATTAPPVTSPPTTINPDTLQFPDSCPTSVETAWDIRNGDGAGELVQALACGESQPLVASGTPIKVGVITPEGPVINFPEYYVGLAAATMHINDNLGGVGANYTSRVPGRPLALIKCRYNALVPSEFGGCVNSLISAQIDVAMVTVNFAGDIEPLADEGIPVLVGTPIFPGDFANAGVRTFGSMGCIPTATALVDYAIRVLQRQSLTVIWGKSAPAIGCYRQGIVTPSDVLSGTETGTSIRRGEAPGFTQVGIPVLTGQVDVRAEANLSLATSASSFGLINQGSECTKFIREMIDAGWSNTSRPLIVIGSCIDKPAWIALGSAVVGAIAIGSQSILNAEDRIGLLNKEYELFSKYMYLYDANNLYVGSGFGAAGYQLTMRFWQAANMAALQGAFSATQVFPALDSMVNHVAFGGGRLSCGNSPAPYASTCDHYAKAYRWNGENFVATGDLFSSMELIGGTQMATDMPRNLYPTTTTTSTTSTTSTTVQTSTTTSTTATSTSTSNQIPTTTSPA